MAPKTGAQIIAHSLKSIGVTVIFGIVGIPVVEIAEEAINLGIRFLAFRNEQACSYAASAYGYLTGRPGVCLVVGGPGVLHAMAGVSYPQTLGSVCDCCYFTTVMTDHGMPVDCECISKWVPSPSASRVGRNYNGDKGRVSGDGCGFVSHSAYEARLTTTVA